MYVSQTVPSSPEVAYEVAQRFHRFIETELHGHFRLSASLGHAHIGRHWLPLSERVCNAVLITVLVDAVQLQRLSNMDPKRRPARPLSLCIMHEDCTAILCTAANARSVEFLNCHLDFSQQKLRFVLGRELRAITARHS